MLDDTGATNVLIDGSAPSGKPGVLVALTSGVHADQLRALSSAERRDALLRQAKDAFGSLPPLRDYIETDWSEEPHTLGAYASRIRPGNDASWSVSPYVPWGRIVWAGTETADVWRSYMEGALQSGERAADEALTLTARGAGSSAA